MRPQDSDIGLICPGCRERDALIEGLRGRVTVLEKRLEDTEREARRQAAPFRRPPKKRKADKAKPGRKTGHEPSYRKPPPAVDECAQVPLERCPDCGGPVHDLRAVEQIIEDIPPVRVHRLRLTTYTGRCDNCGDVRSTHPDQVSTAVGAAGTHLGKNALALAADLSKHLGITMRKVCEIFRSHYGLSLTPGGLSQALARIGRKLQVPFAELGEALRNSPAAHADETGWWVGGQSAWLWVFTNPQLTLYTIGDRSQKVIRGVLGDDYPGVLISDCLASYNPHPGRKSKCCAHHLKAISEALELAPDSEFLAQIRSFFKAAIIWHGLHGQINEALYWDKVAHLQRQLDELLAPARGHPAELRIVNRLAKHRPHLLTFLDLPEIVDPTNNLAERQLRPAVIARKLSCGNKTDAGRATFEVLASLSATCRQQGRSFIDLVAECMQLGLPPPVLFAPE